MAKTNKNFSLREKKYAKTKIALLNEFISRLKKTKFADISIKEICDAVEVSEATFYNYFPQKKDVIFYHEALMGIRLGWNIENRLQDKNPIEIIEEVYTMVSEDIKERNLFNEFITVMIAEDNKHCMKDIEISEVERYFAFPKLEGVEGVVHTCLEDILLEQLDLAKKKKLIKKEVNIEEALIALFSIMVGAPLCLDKDDYPSFQQHYATQLAWFWKAIGTGGKKK